MKNLLNDIHDIAQRVCNNKLERLRIEEELLISYARNASNKNLNNKAEVLRRVKEINKLQLLILGEDR